MTHQEIDHQFQEVLKRQDNNWTRVIYFFKRDLDRLIAIEFIEKQYPDFAISYLPLMGIIADNDGMVSIELAKRAGITRQAMSQIIGDMKRNEYVETKPAPTDARRELIFLTDKGKQVVIDFAHCVETLTTKYAATLGDNVFRQVVVTLSKLMADIQSNQP